MKTPRINTSLLHAWFWEMHRIFPCAAVPVLPGTEMACRENACPRTLHRGAWLWSWSDYVWWTACINEMLEVLGAKNAVSRQWSANGIPGFWWRQSSFQLARLPWQCQLEFITWPAMTSVICLAEKGWKPTDNLCQSSQRQRSWCNASVFFWAETFSKIHIMYGI